MRQSLLLGWRPETNVYRAGSHPASDSGRLQQVWVFLVRSSQIWRSATRVCSVTFLQNMCNCARPEYQDTTMDPPEVSLCSRPDAWRPRLLPLLQMSCPTQLGLHAAALNKPSHHLRQFRQEREAQSRVDVIAGHYLCLNFVTRPTCP